MASTWGKPSTAKVSSWGPSSNNRGPKTSSTASHLAAGQNSNVYAPGEFLENSRKFTHLKKVVVDGLVVLKILKHCQDNLPEKSFGTLLGLDVERTLEVTDSFPHPSENAKQHQLQMMSFLRDGYSDNCCVGWYAATNLNSFFTQELVTEQLNYQLELDQEATARCVLLVFDKQLSTKSNLSLKAYRLRLSFIKNYHPSVFEKMKLPSDDNLLKSSHPTIGEMFEEIPVEIQNPALIQLYLKQINEELGLENIVAQNLSLSTREFLELAVERLIEEGDRVEQEESKLQYYERQVSRQNQQIEQWMKQRRQDNKRRAERGEPLLPETDPSNPIFKPIPAPNKTDSALARAQLEVYCNELNVFAAKSFPKLFATQNVQTSE